eukprot:scaffold199718_cov17-Tisochrysis_lutea.AAC.1
MPTELGVFVCAPVTNPAAVKLQGPTSGAAGMLNPSPFSTSALLSAKHNRSDKNTTTEDKGSFK